MKYGLLVTSPITNYKNIGDYIQTLAALQFTPETDIYVEKENASDDLNISDEIKVIMNAWYMWHPENWPPNKNIIPLFTSVHLSPLTAEKMIDGEKYKYMMEHSPIGCRDIGTLEFLQSKNIPAYFSGCLTLTLGEKYGNNQKRTGVFFVDPYISPIREKIEGKFRYNFSNIINFLFYFFKSPFKTLKLSKIKYFHARLWFMKYYNAAMFYNSYKSRFSDDILFNASYLSHIVPVKEDESQLELIGKAEELIKIYSRAKLVVTSRIHCALPCLGLTTPVVFVISDVMNSKKNIFNAPGRFSGIIDLFRVFSYKVNGLNSEDEYLSKLKINSEYDVDFKNKSDFEKLRDNLIIKCKKFI